MGRFWEPGSRASAIWMRRLCENLRKRGGGRRSAEGETKKGVKRFCHAVRGVSRNFHERPSHERRKPERSEVEGERALVQKSRERRGLPVGEGVPHHENDI